MNLKTQAAAAGIIADLRANRDALASVADTSLIFAWKNGLGVSFNVDPKHGHVCSLAGATAVDADDDREIYNGHGEQAEIVRRDVAIEAYLPVVDDLIAQVEGLA